MDEDEQRPSPARISVQRKLTRVRTPRVHIDYDVEVGDALERRELPFVIGVLADLSGSRRDSLPPLRDRRFAAIDVGNFETVMRAVAPRVDLTLGGHTAISLELLSLASFEPDAVAAGLAGTDAFAGEEPAARINDILHAAPFKQLEATWRGLHFLVTQVETGTALVVKVLNVSKQELRRDLVRAASFDQSGLFRKIYEEPYGTAEVSPFGLLLVDYEFSHSPEDVALLSALAAISGAAHAPFVGAASPALLALDTFSQLDQPRDLSAGFAAPQYAGWRAFRDSADARFAVLTLPRILLRRPWQEQPDGAAFAEHIDGPQDLLWGNAAYAVGVCVANAFVRYGWCANLRGIEGGGLVEGLPVMTTSVGGHTPAKSVTDAAITDRREMELSQLGLAPLLSSPGRGCAVFFSMSTCAEIRHYDQPTANSRLSTQLQYVLTASRFAHYLKCISRDKIGSFMDRRQTEHDLNQWIEHYVLGDDQGTVADKARRPLRQARIEVEEIPGRPGVFRAIAYLRPYYQLEELSVSLRLIVDLGPAVGTLK